jgi:hypothetical protein
VYVVIIITVVYALLRLFEFLFSCRLLAKSWDITIIYRLCIKASKILAIYGKLNIVTDIIMLILLVIIVQKLQLLRKEKAVLASLFITKTL